MFCIPLAIRSAGMKDDHRQGRLRTVRAALLELKLPEELFFDSIWLALVGVTVRRL